MTGVRNDFTYLGDDEGMSVFAVVEMSAVTYTTFCEWWGYQIV